jgi:hypothetical protein
MMTEPDFDFQGFIMSKDNLLIVVGRGSWVAKRWFVPYVVSKPALSRAVIALSSTTIIMNRPLDIAST